LQIKYLLRHANPHLKIDNNYREMRVAACYNLGSQPYAIVKIRPGDGAMPRMSCRPVNQSAFVLLSFIVVLALPGCGIHRYTNPELLKKTVVTFPREYETIVAPLDSELVPIRKQIFFLRHDVDALKNRLWDGGSNQRITRIDNSIDTVRKEISALSAIKRELLNAIYFIYPGYVEPEIVPYAGENKKYKKFTTSIILVTLQDQREYENEKANDEKLSGTIVYKPLIKTAMKQFNSLPDSLKPKIQPIGSAGPVRKLEPYTPPKPR
jgi:hypothetical protein